ncbi:MAG: O-antigen ligase family protein [Candidatus Omnitrophica bacterium]|nr:O-antigen ligase family protein [Candidatus Omnitrophota bacterium]
MEQFISLRGILMIFLIMGGFASILIRPKTGVFLIFLVTVLRDGFLYEWFQPVYDLHLPQTIIILTLIAWLFHSREYPLRFNRDIALMFVYFIVICSTRFFAGTPVFEHPLVNENLRTFATFFLVVQLIRTPKDMRALLWTFVCMHLFLVLRAYYFYKTDYMDIALPNYVYVNRNGFAGQLAAMLPIAYMLGNASKKKFPRYLGLFTALWCIIGVILTYSRGGLLGVFAGIAGLLLVEKRKTKFIIIILLLTGLILPRLSEKYTGRIETIETYQEDASAMGRVAANYAALNMFKENPFMGVGAGNFNDVIMAYTPPEYLKWVEEGKSVHNIVMQVASDMGILGLTIFFLLIGGGFKNSFIKVAEDAPERESTINILRMLCIALFVSFVTAQFGQGAYFGRLFYLLAFLSAMRQNVHEGNLATATKFTPKNNKRRR